MNRPIPLRFLIFLTLAIVTLTSCATHQAAYDRGLKAELSKNYDLALQHYEEALAAKPGDLEYRLKVAQSRFAGAFEHFDRGRRAMEAGEPDLARVEFTRAIQLDPSHSMAKSELARAEELIRIGVAKPEEKTEFEIRKELARTDPSMEKQLQPKIVGPISLRMTQEAESIFETIAELAGLNIIFDPDFRSSQVSIDVENLSIYEALDILAVKTRTFWKPLNSKTLIIAPENQQKRREYESHILKTIYLTNSVNPTDITEAITAIRTLLNMRFVAQSTSMNAIILRDTADKIAIAEKIIDDIDMTKPEVLVEATILEVDRNRLRELGVLPPQGTTLGFTSGESNKISLRNLPGINSGSFNMVIPDSVARFLESDSRTRLVQNPSVRATDGKLAQIRIGSRVPVASGSFQPAFVGATGTPVVQFQYIDVGVNLDITPRVLLNREISMTVLVQVQATAANSNIGGVTLPVFTNRSIEHEIRLKEGETNILGGLITKTESTSFTGIPGLIQIPILKHLFGSESRKQDQTEIIILLRPHIVKMPDISDRNLRGIVVGTETNTRLKDTSHKTIFTDSDKEQEKQPEGGNVGVVPISPESGPTGTLWFDPETLSVDMETPIDLHIYTRTPSISGADLTIEFDPFLVEIVNVLDGGFLTQDGVTLAVMHNVDTEIGRAIISIERPEGSTLVDGEGRIVRLRIRGLNEGASTLKVIDFSLRTPAGKKQVTVYREIPINVR